MFGSLVPGTPFEMLPRSGFEDLGSRFEDLGSRFFLLGSRFKDLGPGFEELGSGFEDLRPGFEESEIPCAYAPGWCLRFAQLPGRPKNTGETQVFTISSVFHVFSRSGRRGVQQGGG